MRHTKGPWRKIGNIIWGAGIQTKVAQLFTQHVPGEKSGVFEEHANASLIAAAPEMLEALELVIEHGFASQEWWQKPIYDAIAKARGEM